MEPIHLTETEAIVYTGLINAAIGFFLGLVPLGFGYFRGRLRIGVIGIAAAVIGGAIFGVLISIPAVAIATLMIMRDRHVLHTTLEPVAEADNESVSGE